MKKILPALITGLLLSSAAHADESPVTAEKLSDHVYVLFGQGGNIAASVGDDGIYIIDDQFAKLSDDIKKTISDLKPGSAEFVINTHHHGDHTGGNENFAKAGAHVIAHDNVHKRLEEKHGANSDYLPRISFGHDLKLHFNNEHAHVVHYAHAHTDGDSVIFFNNDNIVHMGDIYFNFGSLPFVDVDSGGSVDGILAAVNDVIKQIDERTIVIPGHGPVSDRSGLETYAKLVKKAKDLMLNAMQNNASLEQVIKADPLAELGLKYAGWLPKEKVTTLFYRSLK
ncbi:MBL fold metallo-hydrolase [Pseudoalteromonas carrageenovora]|uniref:MBL fold metallo-hydrolase n=1 Tax=Pseudoalteromonas carrageenovora TaxID=227 RepID=UPI0021190808|nr:MBL fold metallo-hydrolase [Pseudoalteromonas carrageenovora]MCQ8891276.1 MBL fold metallo-hydrolase [Pseudoalteromonas carrageenovora]MDO6548444.1 MBL fold metallo-hydrolase [Pseudoalteromonas carrageenovora]MDO6637223.1 MBL fold metallo-hydrolase [Pseudoalteromonas carrageenovora]MDO6649456.1 MBL fold metallo-hydrolase [Pseudoalteromonas carrageenovora]MDO6832866.1 MBL fold metallo-hydrolase [Pseudoalteromonas carrageenovora]